MTGREKAIAGIKRCSEEDLRNWRNAKVGVGLNGMFAGGIALTNPEFSEEERIRAMDKFCTVEGIDTQIDEMIEDTGILYFLTPEGIETTGWAKSENPQKPADVSDDSDLDFDWVESVNIPIE